MCIELLNRVGEFIMTTQASPKFNSLREKIAYEKQQRKLRYEQFDTLWKHAVCEGDKAAIEHKPTPMVVERHMNMLDDNSSVKESWIVDSGVCGFASVHLSDGRSSFARWASKHAGFSKDYRKGLSHWVGAYGQSMERKAKFASTVARILNENGIDSYSTSRMD